MKSTFEKIKWILKQARASLFLLFIIIFIAGVSSLLVVYRAILTKEIIDTASTHTNYDKFIFFIFLFIALLVFNVVINGVSSALAVRCSTSICNNMQKNLFSRLIYTKWSDFSKYHSGDILTRMTSDIDAVTRTIVSLVPSLIQLSVMIIASFITLLAYNPELAIITLCLTPVSIVLFRLFGKRLKKLYMELQTVESKYRSFLNESIQNIVIIKSFCLEKDSLEKINTIQKQKLNLTLKRNKMGIISNSIFDIVSWIAMGIALIVGSISIFNGTSSYGTLTATIQLVGGIQGPFSALAATIPMLISAIGSSERIIEFEELNLDSQTAIDCDMKSVGLNIENVNFSYNINSPILTNCHATIYPGEIVAFIGPSGQGKTTLVRLMLSLVEADSGKIFITNKNQKYEISASSRKLISYVPQGNTMFSGTIANNLRYGCLDASEEELENAAKAACIWDFIKDLPEKFNTLIGEHGIGLSEGQAQRIAIARALIHKTPILIFDEATSALDNETELKILKSIKNLNANYTCIIITHRTAALMICTRIFKIEDKSINEITEDFNDKNIFEARDNLA